ncbi:MAG: glycosyltransferase family 4 protein [Phycisphaerales bacterium]|jgi:glycosyltransferase involved in cell wall biosynthesis
MSAPTPPAPIRDSRPQLAFVVNNLTPYRIQSLLRVKNELPQFRIKTYVTWNLKRNLWVYGNGNMPELGVVAFPDAVAESQIGTPDYYMGDWRTGGKIVEHLKADPPQAMVVAGYAYPAMSRVIRWCTKTKTPWLMWGDSNVHSDTVTGLKRFVKNRVLDWIVKHVDALLICGDNGVRYYQNYGARRDEIFYFPVEPDYHLIDHPDLGLHAQIASQFGLVPGRRRLLVCSRLVPVKAVDQAIDAFAAVAYKLPNLDLVIVGDGPLRADLKARVPSPLRSRVIFAGFFDGQEKVNAFYHQCDVLLHPAVWEPWGVVILEAAAAGLAIITTNVVGAQPEVAIDGRNAVIIRPNDRRGLANAIVHIMRDDVIDAYKAQSKIVSNEFRVRCDLVKGLAAALTHVGVMPAPSLTPQTAPTRTPAE